MDKLLVLVIVALAAGYVIRRFFFKKGGTCGCGCASCNEGPNRSGKGETSCCPGGERRL